MPKNLAYYEALPYRLDLHFDRDDETWVLRFPELPGCMAHGETPEEAIAAGKEAKALWLETALENGDSIPLPEPEPAHSGKLVLRLPKSLHERAAMLAERDGVSLNTYMIQAVAESVERSGLKNMLRFIGGSLERFLSKAGPGAFLLSLFVTPIYGEKDEPIASDKAAELPSVRQETHAD